MKKRFIRYMLWVAVGASLMMCDSGNTPTPQQPQPPQPPAGQCRITSITINYSSSPIPTITQFTYDENGLLSEIIRDNGKSVIAYRTGLPYVLQVFPLSGGDWLAHYEVTLYSNGTLKDITSQSNYPGAKPSSTSFTKFSMTNTAIVGTETVIEANLFSWDTNGDMMRFVGEDDSDDPKKGEYYTYYTDHEYAPKNVDAFTRYLSTYQGYDYIRLFGAPAYDTPHLVKEQKSERNTSTFEYVFDDDGKITKITITSEMGAKALVTPLYDCK